MEWLKDARDPIGRCGCWIMKLSASHSENEKCHAGIVNASTNALSQYSEEEKTEHEKLVRDIAIIGTAVYL
jgi:hypothetical protein